MVLTAFAAAKNEASLICFPGKQINIVRRVENASSSSSRAAKSDLFKANCKDQDLLRETTVESDWWARSLQVLP